MMDIRMPELDGLEATKRIGADARLAAMRVIILTTFDLDDYVYGALRAGASGFLVKDTEPAELIHAVRVVARGDALIAPSVTRRLIAEFAGRITHPDPSSRLNALTEREREVMTLVAGGLPVTRSPRGSCLARHRQDPRQPDHDQAQRLRPRPTGRARRWLAARSSRQQQSLVSALIGYAQRLADLGRHEEAVDALDEAISIGRRNVVDKPAEYETNLGMGRYLRAFFLVEL